MKSIAYTLVIIGLIILSLATVGSIGYGLYLWGGIGLGFAVSAWTAFILWIKLIACGLLSTFIGFMLGAIK